MLKSKTGFLILLLLFGFGFGLTRSVFSESFSSRQDLLDRGVRLSWSFLRETGVFSYGENKILFTLSRPYFLFNHRDILTAPSIRRNPKTGGLLIPETTKNLLIRYLKKRPASGYRVKAVILDPGHGGKDSGASYHYKVDGIDYKMTEKDLVLNIALGLKEKLEKKYPYKNIILTRSRDVYIPLQDRVSIGNRFKLNPFEEVLYVSVHANASLNRKGTGYEVWYLPKEYRRNILSEAPPAKKELVPVLNTLWEEQFTKESIRLGKSILSAFESRLEGVPNRGLKSYPWFVVRNSRIAAVLVEIGFITNPGEAKRLRQSNYHRKIIESLYEGIVSFTRDFEKE